MGAVYKAEDNVLRRFVAIKLLHPAAAANPAAVERFLREAQAAASIGHPNIIDILDFGESDGKPYLVMEYLRGRSLAELLHSEGPLSVSRACAVATHALAGLTAAHERGILHRDLKPANLMLVVRFGDRSFVKLLDFGFAALVGSTAPTDRNLTPARTLVGTPAYAPPERLRGDDRRDPRTDLYSLGVVLYEMLAGVRPFEASTFSELARKVQNDPPPSLRLYRPDVPEALERVVMRSLAKQADDRFPKAEAFAQALVPFGGRAVESDDAESDSLAMDLLKIRARERNKREPTGPFALQREGDSSSELAFKRIAVDVDQRHIHERALRTLEASHAPARHPLRVRESEPAPTQISGPPLVVPTPARDSRVRATEARRDEASRPSPEPARPSPERVGVRERPQAERPQAERPQAERPQAARPESTRTSQVGLPPPTPRALRQASAPASPALPRPVDAQGIAPIASPEPPAARPVPPPLRTSASARNLPPVALSARAFAGSFVLSVLRFVSKRYGERALSAVLARLSPEARRVFDAGVTADSWLPFDAVCALVEAIDAALGRDDLHLLADCGRAVADGMFDQLKRRGPPEPPPELLLAEMPGFIDSLIRGASMRLRSVGRGYGRLELDEQGAPPSLTVCVVVLGFLDRSLSRSGANEVEVNLLNCRYLGDDENIYDISWLVV